MQRLHIAALLAALIIAPAAAHSLFYQPKSAPCFSFGGAQYRIAASAKADYRIRIGEDAASDIRLQLVETPEAADLVLMDDGDANVCAGGGIKTISVDAAERNPDITVSLSREPADHKLYVRSAGFSQQEAAALFAVLWQQPRTRGAAQKLAQRP